MPVLISHGHAEGWELHLYSSGFYVKPDCCTTVLKTVPFFAKFLCLVNKSPYARLHVCIIKILFASILFISSTQKLKSNKGEPQELSLTNVEK